MPVKHSTLNNHQVEGHLSTKNITQNIYQAKPEFFEPNLEQFQPPKFPSPKMTPHLIKHLFEQNLLVLGESPNLDKVSLARHLAWSLRQELQWVNSPGQKIQIKEWYHSPDPQSLDVVLQETRVTTIFILSQILPQHIEQELSQIQLLATHSQHYVLMSTDIPFACWKLSDSDSRFWQNLSVDGLYESDDLTTVLIDKLKESKKSLPPQIISGCLEPNLHIGDLTLQEVAKRLKTPERIACFVELLGAEKESLQLEVLHELIDLTQNDKNLLKRWFNHILKPREQLLALGLNFFNGLFDDQCIAGIGKLVEHEWYRRDPSLQALDYCDLHDLHNFFRLVEVSAEKTKKFESWLLKQRRILFEVAWDSYRVRIQTSLPLLVELVTYSVGQKSFDQKLYGIPVGKHLYGDKLRRDQVREVIGEAISDIGLIDSSEVQESLLTLASHNNAGVNAVAARAIARWCEYGHHKELFDTLKHLKRSGEKKDEKSQDHIMNTMALAVGYAARYDAPQRRLESNAFSPALCDILKQLADYPSRLVRHRFGCWTLPMVVPLYLVDLQDLLHDLTRHIDLIRWISESLALAYPRNHQEVLSILNVWLQECRENTQEIVSNEVPRTALLETVALTYVKILCYQKNDSFTANDICQKIKTFFLEEKHYFSRDTVIKEICHQISRNFQQIEPKLQDLVVELTNEERNQIVKSLSAVYRKQRKQLDESNDPPAVHESDFPIWISLERPSTPMEAAMFRWLKSEDNPTAQMIGARLVLGEEINLTQPQEVLKILNLWYKKSKETHPHQSEALLTAIALISIEIQCYSTTRTGKVTEAFHYYLQAIISQEEELLCVRKSIVDAICSLTDQLLQELKPQLMTLLPEFTDKESHQIVEAIFQAEQRQLGFNEQSFVAIENGTQALGDVLELPQPQQQSSTEKSSKKQRNKRNRKNKSAFYTGVLVLTSLICFLSSYFVASIVHNSILRVPQSPPNSGLKSHSPLLFPLSGGLRQQGN